MKIALIGYGKMGKSIEQMATCLGHSIVGHFSTHDWNPEALNTADICIEFTQPDAVLTNIKQIAPLKKNIVVGTTGWYQHLPEVEKLVEKYQIGLLYSPNFSLGVNIYYEVLKYAAQLFQLFPEYDAAGIEYHHNQKKDSPSGMAGKISELLIQNMPRLSHLPFSSVRCGHIVGIHQVLFDSPFDSITLSHEARSREGFASGAIYAAEWLKGKKGLFTFDDCMQEIIKRRKKACI